MKDLVRVAAAVSGFWTVTVWLLGGSPVVVAITAAGTMAGALFTLGLVTAGGRPGPRVK